jgi:hypothetical protein
MIDSTFVRTARDAQLTQMIGIVRFAGDGLC